MIAKEHNRLIRSLLIHEIDRIEKLINISKYTLYPKDIKVNRYSTLNAVQELLRYKQELHVLKELAKNPPQKSGLIINFINKAVKNSQAIINYHETELKTCKDKHKKGINKSVINLQKLHITELEKEKQKYL